MPYVYSTAANSTEYPLYEKGGGDLPVLKKKVLIKGGAGVGKKHIQTPQGVATFVTDEDLAFLEANPAFKRHVSKGFITVSKTKKDADEVAKNMAKDTGSAPKTPNDKIGKGVKPSASTESPKKETAAAKK